MVIEGMYLRVCSPSFVSVLISVSSPFCVFHLGGVCVLLYYRRIWRFGDRVPDVFGNCRLEL